MSFIRSASLGFCVALSFTFAGCGSAPTGPKLAPVKGNVTLDGKPLESGELTFLVPGNMPSSLTIVNGVFSGEAAVGENRVEVYSYRLGGQVVKMGDENFGGEKENFIPAKFNTMSTLKAQVADAGVKDLKFEVKSK